MADSQPVAMRRMAEEETIGQYRAISGFAIVGLVGGLFSALAFYNPVCWAIPPIAAGFSLAGLRAASDPANRVAGKMVATLGLLLAVAFGVGAAARNVVDKAYCTSQCREFVENWCRLIQTGFIHEAVDWTNHPIYRKSAAVTNLADAYEHDPEAMKSLKAIRDRKMVQALEAAGPDGRLRFLQTHEYQRDGQSRRVVLEYELLDGDKPPQPFKVAVSRIIDNDQKLDLYWRIDDSELTSVWDAKKK